MKELYGTKSDKFYSQLLWRWWSLLKSGSSWRPLVSIINLKPNMRKNISSADVDYHFTQRRNLRNFIYTFTNCFYLAWKQTHREYICLQTTSAQIHVSTFDSQSEFQLKNFGALMNTTSTSTPYRYHDPRPGNSSSAQMHSGLCRDKRRNFPKIGR